jgi:hypothetical protein
MLSPILAMRPYRKNLHPGRFSPWTSHQKKAQNDLRSAENDLHAGRRSIE